MESSNSNSQKRELQQLQLVVKQLHSICMTWFKQLETHLSDLYHRNLSRDVDAFRPAFRAFFSEEHHTFRLKISGIKSDKPDTCSRSENYTTHAVDADIRPVSDQEPFAEDDRRKLDQFTQFRFHSLIEEEGRIRIEEYVQYQDDLWDDISPPLNISSISETMQPTFKGRLKRVCHQISYLKTPTREVGLKTHYLICDYCGGSHEADECKQLSQAKQIEDEEEEDSNKALVVSFYPRTEQVEPLEWKAPENRLKPSSVEPPKLELKELPEHLEYAFLRENNQLPVVISSALSTDEKTRLLEVLRNHKRAIAWSITDIKGIDSSFCTHKILMEDEFRPSVQPQRRVNPNIKEIIPKNGGMTVVKNKKDELIPQQTITGWHVGIDCRKLNNVTRKDHFPLPFIDQMLERLAGHEYYSFLDGFSRYFQIPIAPEDQEKTTFTYPYRTFAYKQMPFRLCNSPATFQRCMTAIFHELSMEVFIDDFSIFGSSLDHCLKNVEKMLKRCEETNLVLNWKKCHFMVKEGIVLGHKVSSSRMEVDKAKIEAISKLPYATNVLDRLLNRSLTFSLQRVCSFR
ncbi:reverse transcriptase domain-containing protein [Tanacetum coccineum]